MEKMKKSLSDKLKNYSIEDLKEMRKIVGGYGGSGGGGGNTYTKCATYTAKPEGGCFDSSSSDPGGENSSCTTC